MICANTLATSLRAANDQSQADHVHRPDGPGDPRRAENADAAAVDAAAAKDRVADVGKVITRQVQPLLKLLIRLKLTLKQPAPVQV